MQTLQKEVSRLVRGHLRTAGYGPPQSVSSFADIQVIHNDNNTLLGAFICVFFFLPTKAFAWLYCCFLRYSCDNRVLRMMRERTLGNSVTQLYKKLMEQHSEAWTQRVLQYLTACEPFTRSSLVQPPVFAEPPILPALPKPKWLLAVYARDVLGRLHEVKAKITSVFGCVLKMDSTKKVSQPCLYPEICQIWICVRTL